MTDMPSTARYALPLLATAQAQKEMTHNEALALIDALLHAAVEAGPVDDPPAVPEPGQCWLVGSAPTGTWAGQGHALAVHTAGGWRFTAPSAGMRVLRIDDGAWLRFDGAAWHGPATIAAPSGGAVVDVEARAGLAGLILLLQEHGLLKSG